MSLSKINSVLIGSGFTAGLVLFLFSLMWGVMASNSEAIAQLNTDIVEFNPEKQSDKLDNMINKVDVLDKKVDILTLIVCENNKVKYCP